MGNDLKTPTDTHSDRQSQRLIFAYKSASLIVVVMGLSWFAFFMSQQWWSLAAADLAMAVVGAMGWGLIKAGKLRAALVLSQIAFLLLAIGFCLIFDVPTAGGPRVSHLFLLVLAMLSYIAYIKRKSVFQLVMIGASLSAFVVFASTKFILPFAQPIPDSIRSGGTWINSIVATAMLCGCVYAMQLEFTRNRKMIRQLRAAVRNGDLELFFQPQIDHAGNVIGAEALLRWKHRRRGYIAPGEFIPIAEESGLMPLIGNWVLNEACRTLALWRDDAVLGEMVLAINVSASQFNVADFEKSVLKAIEQHQIDPTKLKLELTESVIISGMTQVVEKMNNLRAIGISFSLDDFGTGYSSLSYLRHLPIYQLKIDRSFVQGALETPRGASLVRSIVQLGLDLGLVVLAEGVETAPQYLFLLDCGCHQFQGYHFGRPVPRLSFEDFAQDAAKKDIAPSDLQIDLLPQQRYLNAG